MIAASVANLIELIFDNIGSKTPALKLFLGFPLSKSKPQYLRLIFFSSVSPSFWDAVWRVLNFEISYVASLAAFTDKVFGIILRA